MIKLSESGFLDFRISLMKILKSFNPKNLDSDEWTKKINKNERKNST